MYIPLKTSKVEVSDIRDRSKTGTPVTQGIQISLVLYPS